MEWDWNQVSLTEQSGPYQAPRPDVTDTNILAPSCPLLSAPSTPGSDRASSPLPLTSLPPGVCPVHLLPAHPVFPASPSSDGDSPPPGSCSLGTGIRSCSFLRKKKKKKMMSEASPSPASSLTMVSFAMLTPSQIQTLPIFIYMTVLGLSYGI